jgi:uncharacterized protein
MQQCCAMLNRREVLKQTSWIAGGLALGLRSAQAQQSPAFSAMNSRPASGERAFTSRAVEDTINRVKQQLGDTKLARLFENCFPNTLDTTVRVGTFEGKPDTFVITGDIPAMWLRDSSAQVWPYLPLVKQDPQLQTVIAGVIHRQTRCTLIDPYANAFNFDHEGSEFSSDLTVMRPELHERKWEIDSLCYPVRLAFGYWRATGDTSIFDSAWHEAARTIVSTFREQQRKDNRGPYSFRRRATTPNDTLNLDGYGNPIKPVGLIASGFRPSDDACIYPFLVPSNLFAAYTLERIAEISKAVLGDSALANDAISLAEEVKRAVQVYAIAERPNLGRVFAYEVDGFGNQLFMDDANVPSLLSLPYLGCVSSEHPVYRNTRKMVLSDTNPFFFRGKAGEGIGGPHIGLDMIWPLSIIMRGLTSSSAVENADCLRMLVHSDANTGFMHESFHKDDPAKFTRAWFAWANTLFGEFVLKVLRVMPTIATSIS